MLNAPTDQLKVLLDPFSRPKNPRRQRESRWGKGWNSRVSCSDHAEHTLNLQVQFKQRKRARAQRDWSILNAPKVAVTAVFEITVFLSKHQIHGLLAPFFCLDPAEFTHRL